MSETLYCPTQIQFGSSSFEALATSLAPYGNRGLLVAPPSIPFLDEVLAAFEQSHFELIPFRNVSHETDTKVAGELTQLVRSAQLDFVLAFGDEYAIDLAKVVALFAANPVEPTDIFHKQFPRNSISRPSIPLVCAPSSYLTLAEAYSGFALKHSEQQQKLRHNQFPVFSSVCFLSGEWTTATPFEQLKANLFSMLLVAIDVYLSPSLKPHSALLLKKTIDLINRSILNFSEDNLQARHQFFYASYYLCQAIQNTSLGVLLPLGEAIHSLYPDIHKEFPIVVLGTTTMKLQLGSGSSKSDDINRSLSEPNKPMNEELSPMKTIQNINQLARRLRLPQQLRSLGVREEDFPKIIDLFWRENIATIQGRKLSKNILIDLLEQTY